jgi:glycosyltransferase involved in cell wall biosynthesis
MRLALLTGELSATAGGIASCLPPFARALAVHLSIEVHVLGSLDRRSPEAWLGWGPAVFPHRQWGPRAFHWTPGLGRTLADHAPDLVDAQGLWMHQSLVSLRHQGSTGRPYVVTAHGMLDPWTLGRSRWKKRLVSLWFENNHLRRAACLRATAPMEAGHFRAFGLKNPIAVVPNGIDLPDPAPSPAREGRRRLLFLSRLHPKKGIDHLLRAWASLHRHHADWQLVIAGPDEVGHRAAMQKLAADLGLADILWHEPVEGDAKSALYWSADLFVLPTHAENFGLVIAEALAHEVPVITTTNAPWDGLEKHRCGWWIELSDEALVKALDEALSLSNAERRAMGERGRAWMARDFAWPAIARQMHEVYTWVLGGGPPPACVITD